MSLRVCYQIRECLPVTGTVYYLVNYSQTTLNWIFKSPFPPLLPILMRCPLASPFIVMTTLENRKPRSRELSQLQRFSLQPGSSGVTLKSFSSSLLRLSQHFLSEHCLSDIHQENKNQVPLTLILYPKTEIKAWRLWVQSGGNGMVLQGILGSLVQKILYETLKKIERLKDLIFWLSTTSSILNVPS